MKRLDARVRRLESKQAAPVAEYCQCPNRQVDYRVGLRDDDPDWNGESEPIICEICGKVRDVIPVRLTTFEYDGERRRLQTDDSGRVVYSWDDAVAAICPAEHRNG